MRSLLLALATPITVVIAGPAARPRHDGRVGVVEGQPAAFVASATELYVALHDRTIMRSTDRGASWRVRAKP